MNLEDPASPGSSQAPKKIEAYQCNLCPSVFGFKFNAKRHFQKLHPDDEYDGSKITNIKFRCYGCQWGFDTYGSLESHFAQSHPEQSLNPEKVYLGDTQTTAATFQSVKRMKTPTKRKRPPDQSNSRPSSAPGIQGHSSRVPGGYLPNDAAMSSHMMMAAHPDHSPAMTNTAPHPPPPSSYQGDLVCNQCDFRCDNPQSLTLHQQTHHIQQQPPNHHGGQPYKSEQPPYMKEDPYMNYHGHHGPPSQQAPMGADPYMDFKAEEEQLNRQQYQHHHMYHHQQQQHPQYHHHPYDQNYHHHQQQHEYHHYPPHHPHQMGGGHPPTHHMGYDQNHQYHHHQQYQQQQQQPPQGHHYMHPPPQNHGAPPNHGHPPQGHHRHGPPNHEQMMNSPPPYHHQQQQQQQQPQQQQHQQQPMHPTPPQTHQQQVPPHQEHYQHANPQMMPNSSTSSYNDHHGGQHDARISPEEKLVNEALMNLNDQNGNMDNSSYHHSSHHHQQYHDNYSHLPNHHQNGGSSSMNMNKDSQSSTSSKGSTTKQRRVNIGKMFQTHICYVCDARLAKLDCIKMHFKNRHPETNLDLNKVMISRVVCYLCGVRKKEYAILSRHFQVEHKGLDIDPFKIGMDSPSPFNMTPEDEADLQKLPIPEPAKQDDIKRAVMERVDRANESIMNMNENTMDSMDEPTASLHELSFEREKEYSPASAAAFANNEDYENGSLPKKKRRQTRGFKNNKCLMCGKTFSRMTTLKKHFTENHPNEPYDKSKIEITPLPCYICPEAKFTDSRHAVRHFETAHPNVDFDPLKIQVPAGLEIANGANDDEHETESVDKQDFIGDQSVKSNIQDYSSSLEDDKPSTESVNENTSETNDDTEEMFEHVTKKHSKADSLNNKAPQTNCVESC